MSNKQYGPSFSIQDGYGKTREFPIKSDRVLIGRDQSCDLVVDDRGVSRHHAAIRREGPLIYIEDLDSANGTFVNSLPVENSQIIKHMDIVQIGSAMLVLNDPDAPTVNGTEGGISFQFLGNVVKKLEANISTVFKGKDDVVKNMIICLLADGHLLLEDVPGVGKSILAQALAKSIQAQYRRIQFTPDMLPSDITGMNIYDESQKAFSFVPGPIFGNVILADEINRTTPRTQSSLLECMSESSVTIDGRSHVLPKPFFVIATQNPDDYHGTYPLPEPQLDRFMVCLSIGYPSPEAEREILESQLNAHPLNKISYVIRGNDIVHCQALIRKVQVTTELKDYVIAIANATREHPALLTGVSPRASLALMRASQALAAYEGRDYATPRDVRILAPIVLSHRLRLRMRYQAEYKKPGKVLEQILDQIPLQHEDALPVR